MTSEQFGYIIIIALVAWILSKFRKGMEKKRGNKPGELKGEPRLSQRIVSIVIMIISVIAFSQFEDIEPNIKILIVIIISVLIVIELVKVTQMVRKKKR